MYLRDTDIAELSGKSEHNIPGAKMAMSFAWACYAVGLLVGLLVGLRWIVRNDPTYRWPSQT